MVNFALGYYRRDTGNEDTSATSICPASHL